MPRLTHSPEFYFLFVKNTFKLNWKLSEIVNYEINFNDEDSNKDKRRVLEL